MASDLAPRLARNSSYFVIKSLVTLATMMFVTPYILQMIGKELYGVWALAGVITSYAQLSDFGISESLVKYTAEYHALRDNNSLNRLVNSALAAFLVISMVVGALLVAGIPLVVSDLLKIPAVLQAETIVVYRVAIVVFLLNMICGVFSSVIIGSQRMEFSTAIYVLSMVLSAIGTAYFLYAGWGIRGLVANSALVAVVTSICNIVIARRLFPELRINLGAWVDKAMLRQIFHFSWKIQASSFSQVLIFQLDRILLSRYLGLEMVAYYEVGSTMASYVRSFLVAMIYPLSPAASELSAKKEFSMISGLYKRSFKFIVMLAVPATALVVVLAEPIIQIWVGSGYSLSVITLQLLMPAYLVNVLTGPGSFILNGINRPEVSMRSALLGGILNLMLCIILIKLVGYFGLIVGITLSMFIAALYFITLLHNALPGLHYSLYLPVLTRSLLVVLPLALLIYGLGTVVSLAAIPAILVVTGCYGVLTGWYFLKSSYLDDYERNIIRGAVPFL